MALERFQAAAAIREVVSESGYSHRRFIELFYESVGLTPKLYCRVRRFVKVLSRLGREPQASLAGPAIAAGYSGQAHFNREFLEFAGVTPGRSYTDFRNTVKEGC
jgi:methylphosphotriester-DNA--protein-cysteine methyltransferase